MKSARSAGSSKRRPTTRISSRFGKPSRGSTAISIASVSWTRLHPLSHLQTASSFNTERILRQLDWRAAHFFDEQRPGVGFAGFFELQANHSRCQRLGCFEASLRIGILGGPARQEHGAIEIVFQRLNERSKIVES